MRELECPNCHQNAIPLWPKLCLGPSTFATCVNCRSRLTVPTSSIWAAVPFLLAIIVAIFAGSHVVAGVALLIGFLLMCWIDYKYVPLKAKQ